MKSVVLRRAVVAMLSVFVFASPLYGAELRISIAASMTELFKDFIAAFNVQYPEIRIIPNFGPSGGLAKQINQGAPADLYVSANPKWMAFLVERRKIESSTQKIFAHNILVFVGRPGKSILSLADLTGLELIGIGSPRSVPAGQYARQALEKSGLYDTFLQGGKLVMAKDVRQALIYADRGETDGSFVYKTDALLANHAEILFEVPQELYDKVTYRLAITVQGSGKVEAQKFYTFAASDVAKKIIYDHGFLSPE